MSDGPWFVGSDGEQDEERHPVIAWALVRETDKRTGETRTIMDAMVDQGFGIDLFVPWAVAADCPYYVSQFELEREEEEERREKMIAAILTGDDEPG